MLKIAIILGSTRLGRNGEAVAKWVVRSDHRLGRSLEDAAGEISKNDNQGKIYEKTEHKEKGRPVLHVSENLSREEQIAERAHELWQQRHGEHENDLADWFQAEREINEWHQKQIKAKASHVSIRQ